MDLGNDPYAAMPQTTRAESRPMKEEPVIIGECRRLRRRTGQGVAPTFLPRRAMPPQDAPARRAPWPRPAERRFPRPRLVQKNKKKPTVPPPTHGCASLLRAPRGCTVQSGARGPRLFLAERIRPEKRSSEKCLRRRWLAEEGSEQAPSLVRKIAFSQPAKPFLGVIQGHARKRPEVAI